MSNKKRLTLALVVLLGLMTGVGTVKAAAVSSGVRIDGKYPLGVSSDYLVVAGNRIRHLGWAPMNGRFMANSMNIQNDGGSPILNADNANGYLEGLWNPAVVINDYTAENKIDDKIYKDPKHSSDRLTNVLWKMWSSSGNGVIPTGDSKAVKFITDTSKEDIDQATTDKDHKDKLDFIWRYQFDTLPDGVTHHQLSDLTQFKDNDVTKYEFENPKAGKSVQQDISDVANFYANLTPGGKPTADFWANNDQIVNQLHTNTGADATVNGEQSNPTYYKDSDPSVTDIVIDITSARDQKSSAKLKPVAEEDNKRGVVAATIDFNQVQAVNPSVTGISIVLNYSSSFYTDGKLDMSKIPYLILNYKGFKGRQFNWSTSDSFALGNHEKHTHDVSTPLWKGLGAKDQADWSNQNVLNFGSRVLNNFSDAYDLDNLNESYDQNVQDLAGLNEKKAAVAFTNISQMWFGSILVPHGSFYANSSTQGLYIGGVVAANNVTLDNAKLSPSHGDGVFGNNPGGNGRDFPDDLNKQPAATPTIETIDLTAGTDTQQVKKVETDPQATFDYANGQLKPFNKSGINAQINITDAPEKYKLFYQLNDDQTWHQYGDLQSTASVAIPDLEAKLTKADNKDAYNKKVTQEGPIDSTSKQHVGYHLQRKNKITFAMTKEDVTAAKVSADTIESQLSFDLVIKGTLEVIVPEKVDFGTEILGQKPAEANPYKVTIHANEVTKKQLIAIGEAHQQQTNLYVFNPMVTDFNLNLQKDTRETQGVINPFYLNEGENFHYQLGEDGNLSAMPFGTNWIDGILSRSDTLSNPLKSNQMTLSLPYSATYQPTVVGKPYQTGLIWRLSLLTAGE